MQVNKEEHIDKAFINKSWKKMQIALDNELPYHRKSQTKLVALLCFLLLITISALVYMSYLYFTQTPYAELTKERIIKEKIYQADDHPNHDNNTFVGRIDSQQGVRQAKITYPPVPQSDFNERLEEDGQSTPESDKTNPSPHVVQKSFLSQSLSSGAVESKKFQTERETQLPIPLFSLRESLSSEKYKPDFYFATSAFVSNLDYTGYGISLGIELPINKKISVNTGVGLNFISRSYFILPFLERNSASGLKDINYGDLNEANTFYKGLKGFKQVFIPIGMEYHITNKLDLVVGARFRYTYSETIDRTLRSKAQSKISRDKTVENTFFNNSNIGIYTAVQYNINDHFSVSMDTEWGLHSLINNTHISDPSFRRYDLNLFNLSTIFKF